MRKNKISRRRAEKASQPNAMTKRAIREAQLREGLKTFETFADWAKSVEGLLTARPIGHEANKDMSSKSIGPAWMQWRVPCIQNEADLRRIVRYDYLWPGA